jgi:branched-chain amino acid aminotransferase
LDIDVEVRKISVSEVIAAAQNGSLKEMFGAGTAAVISPIAAFGYQNTDYDLPILKTSFATTLKKAITDIQTNKTEDPYGWRVLV